MTTGVRGAFVLLSALVFFLVIVGLFALGMVMRPVPWSERPRLVG